jgi:hypothetical protein
MDQLTLWELDNSQLHYHAEVPEYDPVWEMGFLHSWMVYQRADVLIQGLAIQKN